MEIQEVLLEAGFSKAEVYLHDFDDNGESDEIVHLRKTYENVPDWSACMVGVNQEVRQKCAKPAPQTNYSLLVLRDLCALLLNKPL